MMAVGALLRTSAGKRIGAALLLCTLLAGGYTALTSFGRWKYRDGYAAGVAMRAAQADRDATAASEAATSQLADAIASVMKEQQARVAAEQAASRARARSARAEARLEDALERVRVDTLEMPASCGELATACANAAAAWTAERDTLGALIAVQDTALMTLRSTVADEHTRTRAAVQAALVAQRATFRAPSRTKWAAVGAVLGALTWGVLR